MQNNLFSCVKVEREKLQVKLSTKASAEPKLVVLVGWDDDPVTVFRCELPTSILGSAVLALLASYFVTNLRVSTAVFSASWTIAAPLSVLPFPENKHKARFKYIKSVDIVC